MQTNLLCTSRLRFYKGFILTTDMLLLLLGLLIYLCSSESSYVLRTLPLILYLPFHIFRRLRKVTYDDSSIYYIKDRFEVQILFEDIKKIDIKALTGDYTIHLYDPSPDGKEIAFKLSLWYALNFKTEDAKVNRLRDKIDDDKRKLRGRNHDQLAAIQ